MAAFILECTRHQGMLVGLFPEASKAANAFRGELLGLMAIHWSAVTGCKHSLPRACWLGEDILGLFRGTGTDSRATSVLHPHQM